MDAAVGRSALVAVATLAATLLVALGLAQARVEQECDFSTTSWSQSASPGEVNRIIVGYNPAVGGNPDDKGVAAEMQGIDHTGEPIEATLVCTSDTESWTEFTSELLDHDDSVRLDGAGFNAIPAGYGPVPNSIEATLDGGIGSDRIRGHKGPDAIAGRAGGDVVLGFGGADEIDPGDGRDEVDAGGGGDLVIVGEDGQRDKADCGPGQDQFNADTKDVVERCEIPVVP